VEEIEWSWFDEAESVGITGATSTPQWVMNEIKREIEKKFQR
jgi:4-hydroxy-3-methylbut-2-enyl diphosphate reductase